MTRNRNKNLATAILVAAIALTALLNGCALTYTRNADGTRSLSTGFNPSAQDYKAIHQLTR